MRKMITLIAAAALVASPFAFAEDNNTGNPNDVLQTVPGQENGPTIADAGTAAAAPSNASAGDSAASGSDAAAETPKPKHHKHHVHKHHHHHHTAPAATSPSSEKATPNVLGTEMPPEHPAQ